MVRHKFHLKQWELVRDEAGQFLADIRVCGILEALGEIGVNKKCPHIDEPRFKCHNCGTYQRSKEIERETQIGKNLEAYTESFGIKRRAL